ncbi:Stonustoxin subunit beta [Oryzias melastigma]|uniref:Stonustoxin subunit beta n=1 Tax=Oryzias melastigma TaxID=30732 RepID=A0A834FJL4_ORYME|nr:Stonustoxin subunit beta [Oryzias melastigma]
MDSAAVKMPESRKRKRSSSCSSPRMLIESPGRSEFPASTSISMMSDTSKYNPPNFSLEEKQRSEFTASTSMSMMSDTSKYNPPNFRLEFPAVSSVSMRSDTSKYNPPNFSQEAKQRSEFTGGSSVSMRSDTSKYNPPNFSQEAKQRPEFTGGSSVSMRSDTSKYNPPNFSQEEKQSVGLTYKSIERKGDSTDSRLGSNEKSWIMSCTKSGCYVRHGNEVFHVTSLCPRSSHVGVFLDWEAGELSFYRVSNDNLTFLHTFQECFSDALYAAVEMNPQSYAHFCHVT